MRWLLPGMAALLAAYVAAHSPAILVVGHAIGRRVGSCYFSCSGWVPYGRPLEAASAWLCLIAAAWAASLLARRLGMSRSERLLSWQLLALALVIVPASWVGLLGWVLGTPLLRAPLGPLLTAVPAGIAIATLGSRRRQEPVPPRGRLPRSRLGRLLGATAVALLGTSVVISVSHPPAGYDALSYHGPLAVYYWRDGDLGSYLARQPLAWALAHPGAAELWFGLLRIAAGERIANLGQFPFALLGATAVHVLGRRTGLPGSLAVLGGLAFLGAPMVVVQAGMQLNDLAAGALLLTAVAIAATPMSAATLARPVLLAAVLGLAATTKLAVVPGVAAVIGFALVRDRGHARPGPVLLAASAAFAIVVAPWWIRNLALYGNPLYPAALPLIGRGYVVGDFVKKDGWFVPSVLLWPIYPLIEPLGEMSGFGALFAVGALPGLVVAAGRSRPGPLALLGVVAAVSFLAWWRVTQHEPRLLLGVLGGGFVGVGWALLAAPRSHRRLAGGLLAAAALFSAAVTIDQALRPLAVAETSRAAYYESEWGIDSVAAGLPEQEGLLYHTGYANRSYAGDYPLLGPSQGRTIAAVDGPLTTDSLVSAMREQGFRYAYVPARGAARDTVERMYPLDRFELVHASDLHGGSWSDTRRYLFRLRSTAP